MSASSKKKLRKEQNAAQMTEKQQKEQREAKKLKAYSVTFIVVLVLVVCLALGIAGTTAFVNSGILERNTDALTVGEHTLSSADLNYYYIDVINNEYNNWYSNYGDYMSLYLSLMGLDLTKPLDEQPCTYTEDGKTWAEYFADIAIENATTAYALYDEATANGFTVTEEIKEEAEMALTSLAFTALSKGYEDTEAYLKAMYGHGTTLESFNNYLEVTCLVSAYTQEKYESFSYTEDDISAYNKEHYDDFTSLSYSIFYLNPDDFLLCTAAEDDTEHVHTEAETTAAQEAAEEAAQQLADSGAATVEELNKEIAAMTVYAESTTAACTEYDAVLFTQINDENVAKWLMNSRRKAGDIGVIPYATTSTDENGEEITETDGCYVVMFHEKNENNMNLVNVRHILADFKGGTTDSTTGETVYSEDEIAAAQAEINAVKDTWLASKVVDEQSFIALVADNSDDAGSSGNGGLYEGIYPGQMVEEFNDWCFDENRKEGDYDIIKTSYGYHLMYFVGHDKTTFREYMVENTLRNTDYNEWYADVVDNASATVHTTSRLNLDLVLGG